ncbi:MAG TPA: ABC transporter ATP-binding protein [Thermoanaerobaculia bacterium]|nr:ABC transporter ATP-binding protein [Thermoanaerobaculia bacterium]
MTAVIHADHVTVHYGKRIAVDDATFSVEPGSVYALLGRNGAGKSSLVRALLGQTRTERGRVELFGEDAWTHRERLMERVSVVPEEADAPPEMRVRELAQFSSRLYARWSESAFSSRIARFGIDAKSRFGELSKGQKKQVALALALATSPELVLLDDPTLGLDVVARKSLFEEVIADLSDRGLTVLITTHDLAGVETLADRVGVLKGGRLVLDEETETLKARFRRIRFAAQPVALPANALAQTMVRKWGSGTESIVTNFDDLEFERLREEASLPVAEVAPMSLEEIFIAVTGEDNGAAV